MKAEESETNCSEQKATRLALKNSLEDLRKSQKLTHIGTWRLDVKTNEVIWTDELYKMYGFDPQKAPPPYTEHMKLFTPDSWALLSASLDRTKNEGIPYELELETVTSDGSNGWMWVRGEALYDNNGEISELWGAAQDITVRKQQELLIKKQLNEKEILLREVHHRIKNNIASISNLLELQMQSGSGELSDILSDSISRVNSMKVLYENLLLNDEYELISVKDYTSKLLRTIVELFNTEDNVSVEQSIPDIRIPSSKIFPLGLIINEIITNSMKYAFPDGRKGHIGISLSIDKDVGELVITDDGIGLPESEEVTAGEGFGLTLVKMLAEQLNGNCEITSDSGTRVMITFKIL